MLGAPRVLLDTNVVLDALVFQDPALKPLLDCPHIDLVTHTIMFDELQRVLAYANLRLDAAAQTAVYARYRQMTRIAPMPLGFACDALCLPAHFPKCRDADDQVFLAVALHAAATLVTRDKALLSLRRRAGKFGVTLQEPVWLAKQLAAA